MISESDSISIMVPIWSASPPVRSPCTITNAPTEKSLFVFVFVCAFVFQSINFHFHLRLRLCGDGKLHIHAF